MPESDEQLVVAAVAGDRGSFRVLYERYYARLFRYVAGRLSGSKSGQVREKVEDVTQDCFVAAWEQLSTLSDTSRFRSWLFAIAHNKAQTFAMRSSMSILSDGRDVVGDCDPPDKLLIQEERETALLAAIAQLPELDRDAILDLMDEIESGHKCSRNGTERSRLARARRNLRELLGPDFMTA